MENIAFLTGIADDFDVELARILSENGYKVYSRDAGKGAKAADFATIINFTPDDVESIGAARRDLLNNPGHIDLYIETSDCRSEKDNFNVFDEVDFDLIKTIYTENVLKPIGVFENFLPLIKKGSLKRCCFITSANASINQNTDATGYAYNMSKAGLHNFLQITKNKLVSQGFSFRAYDPSLSRISAEKSSKSAYYYFTRRRGIEGRDDEPNLKIRDAFGREYSW